MIGASSGDLEETATATGGQGVTIAGHASAKAKSTGTSGSYDAIASTSLAAGALVEGVFASAGGPVNGAASGIAKAIIGDPTTKAFALTPEGQALALIDGAPNSATTGAVLAAEPGIAAAFGASPTFFAVGELGGAYASSGGVGPQTITSTASIQVNLSQLASPKDLLIGAFDPTIVGTFSSFTIILSADTETFVDETFTTVAEVDAFFNDVTYDLGSLASGALSGPTLNVQLTLELTTASLGSGVWGDFIIGDPPPASGASAHFVHAMASLGAPAAGSSSFPPATGLALAAPMLVAARQAA